MENFVSGRAESYKTAIRCCGGDETSSVNSKDSMLEAGEYLERLSFWQRPRQKVDLEFIDVTYSVKQNRKGELNYSQRSFKLSTLRNRKQFFLHWGEMWAR